MGQMTLGIALGRVKCMSLWHMWHWWHAHSIWIHHLLLNTGTWWWCLTMLTIHGGHIARLTWLPGRWSLAMAILLVLPILIHHVLLCLGLLLRRCCLRLLHCRHLLSLLGVHGALGRALGRVLMSWMSFS